MRSAALFDSAMAGLQSAQAGMMVTSQNVTGSSVEGYVRRTSNPRINGMSPTSIDLSGTSFAVEGFTKAMAIELGPSKIRVNTICPTFIKTALTENTLNDPIKKDWVLDKIKLNRFGEIEDVMGAVIYLASDVSTLVTGSSMMIDGGWTAD